MAERQLTKESFNALFPDSFQLTGFAIKIAQQQIQSGNEDLNITDMLDEIRRNYPGTLASSAAGKGKEEEK